MYLNALCIFRKMHNFKGYVRNKARPEGSIAEGYCDSECLTFCSMYFHGIETKFNEADRNFDGISERMDSGLSVFTQNVKLFKGAVNDVLSPTEFEMIKWYVLHNCDEVLPYIQ